MLRKDKLYLNELYSLKSKNRVLGSFYYAIECSFLVVKNESIFMLPSYYLLNSSNLFLKRSKSSLSLRRFFETREITSYFKRKKGYISVLFVKLNNLCFSEIIIFNSFLFYCFENLFSLFLKITVERGN